ncbi:cytochrome b5 family heme/steroid binding domain-containing protein [Besnoitia besnoiti]|uniref:Cytochrome b5 family heme/steroid binding domain-containing protein n=1 Tax=Besnoitia besnoiti TaxID=94643 RepID=A0A2A9MGS4_BESBE|nr:cytochrome b5 family heme/steroid binding domain-containing protein [Besnoitia besnoiti]PFH36354.1 cytochrome b5 family heme/steroid binding domain-containing protein [Besnoitia besnoiti]
MSCEGAQKAVGGKAGEASREEVRPDCPVHGLVFTESEVAACNAEPCSGGKCLVIFKNCVYDLSHFSHPGGSHILEDLYGQDITEPFEEAGHSINALRLLDSLRVGVVEERRAKHVEEVGDQCVCGDAYSGRAFSAVRYRGKQSVKKLTPSTEAVSLWGPSAPGEDRDAHKLVDFSKPLLPQVWKLDCEQYQRLVDTPYMKEGVLPLMPYAWMEPFSKTQWWVVPLVWLPVVFFMICENLKIYSPVACAAYVLFGLFAWTFVEYFLHRFVFHFPEHWLPDNRPVRVVHFLLHAVHHFLPLDPLRLVVPPALFVVLSVFVYGLVSLVVPAWLIRAAWPGGMLGYVGYDMIHYSTHHFAVLERFSHIREMKNYHMRHHYRYPLLGFGVSSKLWDHVFGTLIPSEKN